MSIEELSEILNECVLEIMPKARNKGFLRYRTELGCFEVRFSEIERLNISIQAKKIDLIEKIKRLESKL